MIVLFLLILFCFSFLVAGAYVVEYVINNIERWESDDNRKTKR